MAEPDIRAITLTDLPLLKRLSTGGTILDSETGLTRDARGASSALLSSILFPRGLYTLVSRVEDQQVVGQFRYRPEDECAHLVYLAPSLEDQTDDTAWLNIVDALAREAGKHGAHFLVAELEPEARLFTTLRTARFATYARQTIWQHEPVRFPPAGIQLKRETQHDQIGIMSLLYSTIPTMLQHVAVPHSDMKGLVYRKNGQVAAYIALSEGDQGIYLLPYIHTDVAEEAAAILTSALMKTDHAGTVPVYVCVRSYQCWLDGALETLGFKPWFEQAVMVKHIAAGVRQPGFSTDRLRLKGKLEIAPPTWSSMLLNEDEDKPELYGKTDHR